MYRYNYFHDKHDLHDLFGFDGQQSLNSLHDMHHLQLALKLLEHSYRDDLVSINLSIDYLKSYLYLNNSILFIFQICILIEIIQFSLFEV
jgi:hypothetical protein